jgi:hypothetical protein
VSKGPAGVEDPAIYSTYLTEDGRWLITCIRSGTLTKLPGFLGSSEDADAVAAVFNARELDRYRTECRAALAARLRGGPTVKEIAERLGIRIFED